jgi:hypothetical protein
MSPTEYAAEELAAWQRALSEQREAEEELTHWRGRRAYARVLDVAPRVQALAARAVEVKCTFRDFALVDTATTQSASFDESAG